MPCVSAQTRSAINGRITHFYSFGFNSNHASSVVFGPSLRVALFGSEFHDLLPYDDLSFGPTPMATFVYSHWTYSMGQGKLLILAKKFKLSRITIFYGKFILVSFFFYYPFFELWVENIFKNPKNVIRPLVVSLLTMVVLLLGPFPSNNIKLVTFIQHAGCDF